MITSWNPNTSPMRDPAYYPDCTDKETDTQIK